MKTTLLLVIIILIGFFISFTVIIFSIPLHEAGHWIMSEIDPYIEPVEYHIFHVNEKNNKTYIYVKLTHYDIASLIGSTRETTTASLNDFKREGLIDFDGRKLVILNKEGLKERMKM